MSDFSDRLKAQANIVEVVADSVPLQKTADGGLGRCPFHAEKTPSFRVHAQRGFYYCFGCHASGDVYKFLMETQKIDFPEAVALLAERLHVPLPRPERGESADPMRGDLLRMHAAAVEFFRRVLASPAGAPARAYLQSRELDAAAVERFHLGFAPESGRALAQHLEASGYVPDMALRGGLCQMRRESGAEAAGARPPEWVDLYDRFRGRLMFPIADEHSRTIAFGGRVVAEPAGERPQPKYLNSPESPIYTKGRVLYNLDGARAAMRNLNYTILVEGYLDCIRVAAAGFHNVVASCGTALTPAQAGLLARHTRTVLVNFDPDAAGAAAAERSIGLLLEQSFEVRVVTLEGGLDPDLYVRRHGRAGYETALLAARPFFDYLLERAARQLDLARPEGKIAALNQLLPHLARVESPLTRQNLADNLAARLQVEQPIVRRELQRAARERRSVLGAEAAAGLELLPAERLLLRCWLEQPELRAPLRQLLQEERLLQGLVSEAIFERLQTAAAGARDTAAMAEMLPPSERSLVAGLLMGAHGDLLTEAGVNAALDALRERSGAIAARREIEAGLAPGASRVEREELLRREHRARAARHSRPPAE